MEIQVTTITPVLTVSDATEAIAFYHRAFDAQEIHRNVYPDGRIVVEMAIESARFRVADEAPESSNLSPKTLGGTSVRLNLFVADPDGFAARAVANGATEIAPIADQGLRAAPGTIHRPLRAPLAHWPRIAGNRDWAVTHPG